MKDILYHTILPLHDHEEGHGNDRLSFCALLIRHEIAYDIHFFTYKTARIVFAEVKNEDRKEVVLPKTTADWLDRHITSAVSKVRSKIRFACRPNSFLASDEILRSPHQFPIPLVFDKEWNEDPQTLCDAIHDFVVKQCIADWSQYALASRFAEFQLVADDALNSVHDIACAYSYHQTTPFI